MIKTFLVTLLCSISMAFGGWKDQSLKDVTKPYLGEYECTQSLFNGEECLQNFDYITLTLKKDNKFTLCFCEKGKSKKTTQKGKFAYNPQTQTIVLKSVWYKGMEREFPLQDGELSVTIGLGNNTLSMKFKQK